jgi:hypothetical protein
MFGGGNTKDLKTKINEEDEEAFENLIGYIKTQIQELDIENSEEFLKFLSFE